MNYKAIIIALFICLPRLSSLTRAQSAPSINTLQTNDDAPEDSPGGKADQPVRLPPMTIDALKPQAVVTLSAAKGLDFCRDFSPTAQNDIA